MSKLDETARLFKALGDPTRLRIAKMLGRGELCVCQLTAALGMGQSRISRHLSILKGAGLITDRRVGKWVHYRLRPGGLLPQVRRGLSGAEKDEAVRADRKRVKPDGYKLRCRRSTGPCGKT